MSKPICGHNVDALRWALESDDSELVIPGSTNRTNLALIDVRDPIKLAAIIAELLRECGSDVWLDGAPRTLPPRRDQFALFPQQDMIQVYPPTTEEVERSKLLAISQARTFALRLLDSPRATGSDILGMIGDL